MSKKLLRQNSDRTAPLDWTRRSYGADLSPGPVEHVAIDRHAGASLAFTGRRIALHHLRLPWGDDVSVTLWQRQKTGYVIAFQTLVDGALRPHAAGIETLDDAICFLEDYCTRLPPPLVEPVSLEQTLIDLHRGVAWRGAFLTLVGEALADWVDLPARGAKKQQNRATA